MELFQITCPTCKSSVFQYHTTYATQHHGSRIIYKCTSCLDYFSETKKTFMEGLKTPVSVIWQVLKARTEGMGLNAAARTFEKAKNTILAWERNEFIPIKSLAATESGALESYAGHSRVPSPDHGYPLSRDGCDL